jgi:hypothetical protein
VLSMNNLNFGFKTEVSRCINIQHGPTEMVLQIDLHKTHSHWRNKRNTAHMSSSTNTYFPMRLSHISERDENVPSSSVGARTYQISPRSVNTRGFEDIPLANRAVQAALDNVPPPAKRRDWKFSLGRLFSPSPNSPREDVERESPAPGSGTKSFFRNWTCAQIFACALARSLSWAPSLVALSALCFAQDVLINHLRASGLQWG